MSVGSWLIGITIGVRRIITSVSRKVLTFGSQFVESRRRVARLALCSPAFEASGAGGVGFGSGSSSLNKCKIPVAVIWTLILHSIFVLI